MSAAPSPASSRGRGRMSWPPAATKLALEALLEAKRAGRASGGGWKNGVYVEVSKLLNQAGYIDCNPTAVKNHWNAIKAMWKEWLAHVRCSGWGLNAQGIPVNDDDKMDEYFKEYPQRRQFRNKAPDNEAILDELIGGRVAIGNLAGDIHMELAEPPASGSGEGSRSEPIQIDAMEEDEEEDEEEEAEESTSTPDLSSDSRSTKTRSLVIRTPARSLTKPRKAGGPTHALADSIERSFYTLAASIRGSRDPEMEKAVKLVHSEFKALTSRQRVMLIRKIRESGEAQIFNDLTREERVEFVEELTGVSPRDQRDPPSIGLQEARNDDNDDEVDENE